MGFLLFGMGGLGSRVFGFGASGLEVHPKGPKDPIIGYLGLG